MLSNIIMVKEYNYINIREGKIDAFKYNYGKRI